MLKIGQNAQKTQKFKKILIITKKVQNYLKLLKVTPNYSKHYKFAQKGSKLLEVS